MNSQSDKPRVFAPGDVTICVGLTGARVYVGTHELDAVASVSVDGGTVDIEFATPTNQESAIRVEEQARAASSAPFVRCRTRPAPAAGA